MRRRDLQVYLDADANPGDVKNDKMMENVEKLPISLIVATFHHVNEVTCRYINCCRTRCQSNWPENMDLLVILLSHGNKNNI